MKKKALLMAMVMAAALLAFGASGCQSSKESFPDKALKVIVPIGAGGVWDVYARALSKAAETHLKQPVAVENVAGGAMVQGTAQGLSAKADGYNLTWLMVGPLTTQPYLSEVPYKLEQIEPIMLAISDTHVLAVPSNAPVKDLKELFTWAKSKGTLKTGINTVAGIPHLALLRLSQLGGVNFNIVPGYKQMPEVLLAMQNGQLDFGLYPTGIVDAAIKEGKIRVIATVDDQRHPKFPSVATAKEQGYPVTATVWAGLAVPKGTPADRVQKIHDAFKKALESDEVKNIVSKNGGQVTYLDKKAWLEKIIAEQKINKQLIEDMKAKGQL